MESNNGARWEGPNLEPYVILTTIKRQPLHKAGCVKDRMYAALPLQVERLFLWPE